MQGHDGKEVVHYCVGFPQWTAMYYTSDRTENMYSNMFFSLSSLFVSGRYEGAGVEPGNLCWRVVLYEVGFALT